MAYLEGITLEHTIGIYEETLKIAHSPVDSLTLDFLKELKAYRDAEEQCIKETSFGFKELLHKWKVFTDDVQELLAYRRLEEQGLLPRFYLGDEFWVVSFCHRVSKAKIVMLQQKKNGTWKYRFCDEFSHTHDYEENELGKYFFFDKEGAETRAEYEQERWEEQRKKLESMKGE